MKKESLGEKDDDYREKQTEKGLARRAAGRTVRAGLDQPEVRTLTVDGPLQGWGGDLYKVLVSEWGT